MEDWRGSKGMVAISPSVILDGIEWVGMYIFTVLSRKHWHEFNDIFQIDILPSGYSMRLGRLPLLVWRLLQY